MIRKFNINNYIKGRIDWQMQMFIDSGAIRFEDGEKINTHVVIIDESKIPEIELNYLYKAFLVDKREVVEK